MQIRFSRTFSVAVSAGALVAAMMFGYASGVGAHQDQPSSDALAREWARKTIEQQQRQRVVLSGDDVGFRLEPQRQGTSPVGQLVVRVNGEWVEARIAGGGALLVPAK